MKINQIIESSTTAGSVATVPFAMNGMQTRNPSIYGQKKVGNLFKGKKTSKPYANSLTEGRVKELAMDLKDLTDAEFQKKYDLTKKEARKMLTSKPEKVNRDDLQEEDLILVPGHGRNSRGFISKASDRTDREVEMAKGDLYQSIKNAKMIFDMLGDVSEEDGIEGWVQEKIIKASDYLNTVREYMEQQRFANEMTGGVIGNGMAGESVEEAYDPNDESDVWYKFDSDSKKILRKFIRHTQTHLAKSQGWSESPDQAMRAHGYFPSKFKPNQFVKKGSDGKWISVTPVSEAKKKVNPYAVGMAQAMKSTGDKPPLKKSTIVKAHAIAKKIKGEVDEGWKSKLAGAALAGAAAFGGGGAHAADLSHYNTDYLQKAADENRFGRYMVSVDDAKAELQARANGKQQAVSNQSEPQPSAAQQARADYIKKLPQVDSVERTGGPQATVTVDGKEYQGTILQPDDPRPRFGPGTRQARVEAAQLGFRGLGSYVVYFVNDRAYIELR